MRLAKVPELPQINPDESGDYLTQDVRRYNLCRLMIERGWTTQNLADTYGKSENAVYQWITGRRNIGPRVLTRLARCFAVSKEEFDLRPLPELNQAYRILSGTRAEALKKFLALLKKEEDGDLSPEAIDYLEDSFEKIEKLTKK